MRDRALSGSRWGTLGARRAGESTRGCSLAVRLLKSSRYIGPGFIKDSWRAAHWQPLPMRSGRKLPRPRTCRYAHDRNYWLQPVHPEGLENGPAGPCDSRPIARSLLGLSRLEHVYRRGVGLDCTDDLRSPPGCSTGPRNTGGQQELVLRHS